MLDSHHPICRDRICRESPILMVMSESRFATNSAFTSGPEIKAAIAEGHPDGGKVPHTGPRRGGRCCKGAAETGSGKLRRSDEYPGKVR